MKVVIIGGVAAGTKLAAKLMRENRGNEVLILTKGADISYAGCGLPYYVGGVIQEREQLIVNTPAQFAKLTGAAVRTRTEVTAVSRAEKTVTAVSLDGGAPETIAYDKLVIATGARPFVPPVPGVELQNVFTMRTPEDAGALRAAVDGGAVKRAVVVGGGFIGLEVAENLLRRDVRVSVIDMADHILPGFDPELQTYVEEKLADAGVPVFTGTALTGIEGTVQVEKVLTGRRAMKADAVVLAIGIRPNTEFLRDTGLDLCKNGTIRVNETLQTNDPDIYAVGDCACVKNEITGGELWSPMGSSANMEGRAAARHMAGGNVRYRGAAGTGICRLPGLDAGHTGLTAAGAREAGFDPVSVVAVLDDKAHYYPGAGAIVIKLTADRATRRLLGAQALGKNAVDKVIDVAVTGITLGATIDQLSDMDLAYAPPFSTAIHPFCHAINILKNKIDGALDSIGPEEYEAGAAAGYSVIDASRQPAISGAAFVNPAEVEGKLPQFGTEEKLLLVCTRGKRAYLLQNRLKYYGYTNTRVLEGGTFFNGTAF